MTRVLLILSICLAIYGHRTDATLTALFSAVTTAKEIFSFGSEVKTIAQDYLTGFEDSDANVIRHLNVAMRNVTKKLYHLEENLLNEINQVRATLLHRLPLKLQRDDMLQQLTTRIDEVNDVYENFVFYQSDSQSYERTTITRFMTELVGDSSKLNHALDRMFDQLLSREQISPNLLSVITAVESHDEAKYEERCDKMSAQKKLFEIYQRMILTEMQGYAMNVYAFGVLKQMENATYTAELDKLEIKFQRRCGQYLRSVKSAMSRISTEIHLCEPDTHIRDETFVEFVGLFQTFIDKEHSRNIALCGVRDVCPISPLNIVASTEITRSSWENLPIPPCMGRLFNCNNRYGNELSGCRLPETDSRRYAWIKNEGDEIFGEYMTCPNVAQIGLQRSLSRYALCFNCACLCADDIRNDSKSYKRINFQPQIADIRQNMVVTGVKMVMKNRMLHFQIEQGKLKPLGEITTVLGAWKSINQSSQNGEEGIDFGNLRYEQRTINLDDVIVPDNFVVTGVKFAYRKPRVSSTDWQPFEIQVHATEYNFETGNLETWNSIWVSAKTMETDLQDYQRARTEVTLDEPHNPIKTTRNTVFSRPNQFIKLRESDFRKDAGQSTIPYLDARPVSMEPRFALSGIGLFHRGRAGFGGFLGLRLFGLNIASHMKSDLS